MDEKSKLQALEELGFKLQIISKMSGLDKGTISRIMNGVTLDIKPENKEKLGRAFKAMSDQLKIVQEILNNKG